MNDSNLNYPALDEALASLKCHRIKPEKLKIKQRLLGSGGYGEVRLAVLDERYGSFYPGSRVAVKQLRHTGGETERAKLAFALARELKLWVELKHPHILDFVAFYLSENMEDAWIVSGYEPNGNVRVYIADNKVSPAKRLELAHDTTLALAFLHDHDPPISHGDLKADNVLVNQDHRAVLCDFGLTRMVAQSSGLTTSTDLKGSIPYLSPELLESDEPKRTLESDIWAWACLLVEIFAETAPFASVPSQQAIMLKIMKHEIPFPQDVLQKTGNIKFLLEQCWSPTPSARPDADRCLDFLEATQRTAKLFGSSVSDTPARLSPPPPRRPKAKSATGTSSSPETSLLQPPPHSPSSVASEVKTENDALRKKVAQQKSAIAMLKERLDTSQAELKRARRELEDERKAKNTGTIEVDNPYVREAEASGKAVPKKRKAGPEDAPVPEKQNAINAADATKISGDGTSIDEPSAGAGPSKLSGLVIKYVPSPLVKPRKKKVKPSTESS